MTTQDIIDECYRLKLSADDFKSTIHDVYQDDCGLELTEEDTPNLLEDVQRINGGINSQIFYLVSIYGIEETWHIVQGKRFRQYSRGAVSTISS